MKIQAYLLPTGVKRLPLLWFYSLDLLVDDDADGMLGYIVDSASLAVVALMRHSFLNGTCALESNKLHEKPRQNINSIVTTVLHANVNVVISQIISAN